MPQNSAIRWRSASSHTRPKKKKRKATERLENAELLNCFIRRLSRSIRPSSNSISSLTSSSKRNDSFEVSTLDDGSSLSFLRLTRSAKISMRKRLPQRRHDTRSTCSGNSKSAPQFGQLCLIKLIEFSVCSVAEKSIDLISFIPI